MTMLTRGVIDPFDVPGGVGLEVGEDIASAHLISAMQVNNLRSKVTSWNVRKPK